MKTVLRWIRPENRYLRWIRFMGLVIAVGTYAFGIFAFVLEIPALLAEGIGGFVFHLFFRLGVGVFIAFLVYLPYYIASTAAQKTGRNRLFTGLCFLVFVVHIGLSVYALFFPQGSTAAVGIIFFPLYLAMPLLAVWGVVHIASWIGRATQ